MRLGLIGLASMMGLAAHVACRGEPPGGTTSCPDGTERCPCFANLTCHAGLRCLSDLCVKEPGSAAGSGGNTFTTTSGTVAAGSGTTATGSGGTTGAGSGGSLGGSAGSGGSTSGPGGAGGVVITGAGGSSGSGGSGINPDANCGTTKVGTKQLPSDIFIMQDKSGSMLCPTSDPMCMNASFPTTPPTRWDAFVSAVNAFVNSPAAAGVGVGIGFFGILPGGSVDPSCNAVDYAMPVVPIMPLPGNANAINAAVAANMPAGGTPTEPALRGGIDYCKRYAMNTPGRTAAVVLITDGYPQGCNSTIENVTTAATNAFLGTPSIKTYVVGIGNVANLDQVAHAGVGVPGNTPCAWSPTGTTECYFDANGDVAARLAETLKTITGMVSCNFAIPPGTDVTKVNVQITIGASGIPVTVPKVNSMAECPASGGWYYDINPPGAPTMIILCPSSCDPLRNTPNSNVDLLLGCPPVPPP